MLYSDLLRIYRIKHKLTQENLASILYVTPQAISKWEKGTAMPSLDNLLSLSDIYNVSIDELLQGSPYFKKPLMVGKNFTHKKFVSFIVIWLICSLFLTGFGYQSFWLFLLVFCIGLFTILPTIFSDYWIIDREEIKVKIYNKKNLNKMKSLFSSQNDLLKINYKDIKYVSLIRENRAIFSPFDTSERYYDYIVFYVDGSEEVKVNIGNTAKDYLPQFIIFLERKNIMINDENEVLKQIILNSTIA